MRILVVEDDPELVDLLARGLRQSGYAVDTACRLAEADQLLRIYSYDLLCLDLRLPDGDGVDLCRALRGESADPELLLPRRILMLTARDGVPDRVGGLDAGADDYLVKPFALDELLARVRALFRRDRPGDTVLSIGDVRLNTATQLAWRGDRELGLTTRELGVLRYLLTRPGEVVSAEELLEHVWDAHADPFTNSVLVILSRLRGKLGDPPLIETIRGAGYRLRGPT